MVLDSDFDIAMPAAGQAQRVDLRRVLTGLRHLTGSAEPGRVSPSWPPCACPRCATR